MVPTGATVIDADYGMMHRIASWGGTWFRDSDVGRLAPSRVVNEIMWNRMGAPDLRQHPTVTLDGPDPVTAVVIGVTPSPSFET